MSALRPTAAAPGRGVGTPADPALPWLDDRGVLGVLLLAAGLLALSWSGIRGYQLADSVEYLERAQAIARRTELIDSTAIRSFGYSGLFVPLFAVVEVLGLEDLRPVVWVARLMQIVLCLATVFLTIRFGARLGGRHLGLAAGVLLAANPILLRWGVSPVSDVAASFGVTLGVLALLDRGSARRALLSGVSLGAAMLMAYKVFLLVCVVFLIVVVRDGRRNKPYVLAFAAGVLAMALVQCVADALYYGTFGISLGTWLVTNVAGQAGPLVHSLGELTGVETFKRVGYAIYNFTEQSANQDYQQSVGEIRRRFGRDWYLTHATLMLPWPALAMLVLGVLIALRRPTWRWALVVGTVALDALVLSFKGDKNFRLWLPVLPLLSLIVAHGWCWLGGYLPRQQPGCGRRGLAMAVLAAICVLSVRELAHTNRARFGAFWTAMEIVDREARESLPERERAAREAGLERALDVRVACAYHWAVFLRESSRVELIKLPHHLDHWNRYDADQRRADLDEIHGLDWFITHLPLLTEHEELFEAVNRDYAIHSVLYERATFEDLGPLYVLRKRRGGPRERTFYDVVEDGDPTRYRAAADLRAEPVHFGRPGPDGPQRELVLLGWEYDQLPRLADGGAGGHGWITYHWWGGPLERDYHFIDRLTPPSGRRAWQNNHAPAYGMLPTSTWEPGRIVREGYLVVAEEEPFNPEVPTRPMGGDYRRGDRIPVSLWMEVVAYRDGDPETGEVVERLEPFRPRDGVPLSELAPPGGFYAPQGHRTSADSMTLVGRFFLPVRREYRVPDDGRGIEE